MRPSPPAPASRDPAGGGALVSVPAGAPAGATAGVVVARRTDAAGRAGARPGSRPPGPDLSGADLAPAAGGEAPPLAAAPRRPSVARRDEAPIQLAGADWFVPGALGGGRIGLLRARFLVIASFAIIVCSVVFSGLFWATGAASRDAIVPILVLGALCGAFPFALRAGVPLPVLSGLFVILTQAGLIASVMADRGLADPGVMWILATPLLAAFVGGARLAWASWASASAFVVALTAAERAGVLPSYTMPGFDLITAINAVGCALVVTGLAVLYEGPVVRHFRHLSRRLADVNGDLRAELAERERAQAAAERDRARAEAASRAKDVLLANVSHEFRTPLTAILGFADLLAEDVAPELLPYLGSIDRGAHRLLSTLDAVLGLAWVESGCEGVGDGPCDVRDPAAAVVDGFRPAAEARGLRLDLVGGAPPAAVSPDLVRRVTHALVDNAIRFTEAGAVTVALDADADRVWLAVSDTGAGMTREFQALACEPFRQFSEGEARTHEGVGVGLTMASRLADCAGGTLRLASELGRGTTVTVSLPRVDASAARPAPPLAACEPG